MSAQSEAALLAREQFAESDPIDGSRLIGAVVDIPGLVGSITGDKGDLGHAIGPSFRVPAAAPAGDNPVHGAQLITEMVDLPNGLVASVSPGPSSDGSAPAAGSDAGTSPGGVQLIGGMVDLPAGLVSSVTPGAGADNQVPVGTVGVAHPHLGAQLIGGTVDLPGGLFASATPDLPENLGHRIGPSPLFPAGAAASGADSAAGQGQLHQLVTAMAGFGGDQGSVITNLTVQNEVESARTTLAASLHFAQ
ncbi:MAG: hypothetical protein WCC64_11090 [Aliidongia sp.]